MRDIFIPGRVATLQGEDPEEENIGHVRSSLEVCCVVAVCVRLRAAPGEGTCRRATCFGGSNSCETARVSQ